jgi:2-hydroxychromene-2-carboxylate isomerase
VKCHGITRCAPNPFFSVNTLVLMRGAIAARRLGVFARYVDEVFRHNRAEPRKRDDPDLRRAAARGVALGDRLGRMQRQDIAAM